MRLGVQAALVDGTLLAGDVAVDGGVIAAVGLTGPPGRGIAAPGFVDLQVNGFAGVDLMGAGRDGWARAGEALLASGTTAWLPTFVTAPEPLLRDALRGLPDGAAGTGPRVLGAHLEGPFLSPERLGVHPAEHRRDPDPALLNRLLDAGRVRLVTLAPELPGAGALIAALVARGIVVAAGHSAATAEQAHRAFDAGVATVTHLHNAMAPGTPRKPGLATAALARPEVTVQLIADGHHLADDTVRVAWLAARGRLALVSDAVAAAGMGDGAFRLGERVVHARDGAVRTADGRLAGSVLTAAAAVRNLHALGAGLEDALGAASTVPARIAGRPDLGRIAVGAPADVVVLDDRLEVRRVLVGGVERS